MTEPDLALYRRLTHHRRNLHQLAEPSFGEWRTLEYIVNSLRTIPGLRLEFLPPGLSQAAAAVIGCSPSCLQPHQVLGHEVTIPGLKASFDFKKSGHSLALRCDLDALPIKESTAPAHLPAASGFACTSGFMHACGHDGHMALLLSLIEEVGNHLQEFATGSGDLQGISFIFQGAEEGCRGAELWVQSNLLADIDDLFCLHLGMGLADGCFVPRSQGFLASIKFDVRTHGKKAHAGRPQEGAHALYCLASFMLRAQELQNPAAGRLINFGSLSCEGARNIIPDLAFAEGEIRARDSAALEAMQACLEALSLQCMQQYPGCQLEICRRGQALPINGDSSLKQELAAAAAGCGLKLQDEFDFRASEDASLLIDKVQKQGGRGIYSVIGATLAAGHHQAEFDFNESALLPAFRLYFNLLKNRAGCAVSCP